MLHNTILLVLALLFAMGMLFMLSRRLGIPYPIFLVLGGLAIGFIPGTPVIEIDPEMIFLIFLPPLLYEAAWFTSWFDFFRLRRPILMLGFGMVVVTAVSVAYFSASLIPGFTIALGFVLGGIVSPPDAVAASSVLKDVNVPKTTTSVLEGESLVNDAASLIVFRFAVAAVLTGHFVLTEAVVDFFKVSMLGTVIGVALAAVIFFLHRLLPTTSSVDTVFTIMTPYVLYLAAEHFHVSGVLSVVSGGLFLSFRSHDFLDYRSRIQTIHVWSALGFVLNGMVFILIGLELPVIVGGLGDYSLTQAIIYALLVCLVVIAVRIICVFPIAYLPFIFRRSDAVELPSPRVIFLTGWAGMRGVVSLASALAIPLTLVGGEAFPQRNLIIFITFIVILVTLVLQGLSLPFLVKWLKIDEQDDGISRERQLAELKLQTARLAMEKMDREYEREIETLPIVRQYYQGILTAIDDIDAVLKAEDDAEFKEGRARSRAILIDVIESKRQHLLDMRRSKKFDEDVLRDYQELLDMEEARARSLLL